MKKHPKQPNNFNFGNNLCIYMGNLKQSWQNPIPKFHEKELSLIPSLSETKKGPISCVAPYPTEEHPGPETYNI